MTRFGWVYEAEYSETFNEKKEGAFRLMAERIEEKCNLIRQAPYAACRSERLKGNLRGKRSGQLDRRYRLVYMVCEECVKQCDRERNLEHCPDCEGEPLRRIRFINITDYH